MVNGANVGNAVLKFDLEGNYLGEVGFPFIFSRQKLASEKVHYSFSFLQILDLSIPSIPDGSTSLWTSW